MSMMFYYAGELQNQREVLDSAISQIRARLGLSGSPRVISRRGIFVEYVATDRIYEAADQTIYCSDVAPTDTQGDIRGKGGLLPDGVKYAVRETPDHVEVVPDMIGSINLWFYCDEKAFIVSSSMRVATMLAGICRPDKQAFNWFLCNGNLCPERSWSLDLKPLCGGQILVCDAHRREVRVRQVAETDAGPSRGRDMGQVVRAAIDKMKLDDGCMLALSGGIDSRVILYNLHELGRKVRCMTYTSKAYRDRPEYDAVIAGKLCARLGMEHQVIELEPQLGEPGMDELYASYHEYVTQTEGALDEFALQGDLFGTLRRLGVRSLMVGDEAFGWMFAGNARQARQQVGVNLSDDYARTEPLYSHLSALFPSDLPERFRQRPRETASTWQDRLYRMYRIPCFLNVFTAWRSRYMNSLRPFLFTGVVRYTARLPDRDRQDKSCFRKYARCLEQDVLGEPIPHAAGKPFVPFDQITQHASRIKLARYAIDRAGSDNLLYDSNLIEPLYAMALKRVSAGAAPSSPPSSPRGLLSPVKAALPPQFKYLLRSLLDKGVSRDENLTIQYSRVLFRMSIASTITSTLRSDATALKRQDR